MVMRRLFSRRSNSARGPVITLAPSEERSLGLRRAQACALLLPGSPAITRVEAAPAGYLLTHGPADIARHAQLLEPLPTSSEVRVAVTPAAPGWHVDVAARDQPGLVAWITGVLAAHGLDVTQAVIATWDDGAALDAFIVGSTTPPDAIALQRDLQATRGITIEAPPILDAIVEFDDDASPWYTRCDMRAPDRTGLLHALAVAVANAGAGANIHAASARTIDGIALDRFDLTDRAGNKLTPATQLAIRGALRLGTPVARSSR